MAFVKTLLELIFDGIRGLYYLVVFIFELLSYCQNVFIVLPSEITGLIISVFTVSICIIVYKVVKG